VAEAVSVPALETGSVVFLVTGALAVPVAVAMVSVEIGVGRLEVRARVTTAIVLSGGDASAVARVKREIGRAPFAGGIRIGGVLPLIPVFFAAAADAAGVARDAAERAVDIRFCTASASFGLHSGRIAFHLAGPACHDLGHVIANALPLPRDLIHGLADTSACLLKLVGCTLASIVERLGQPVSEF
jgi:hypothetical protein